MGQTKLPQNEFNALQIFESKVFAHPIEALQSKVPWINDSHSIFSLGYRGQSFAGRAFPARSLRHNCIAICRKANKLAGLPPCMRNNIVHLKYRLSKITNGQESVLLISYTT